MASRSLPESRTRRRKTTGGGGLPVFILDTKNAAKMIRMMILDRGRCQMDRGRC